MNRTKSCRKAVNPPFQLGFIEKLVASQPISILFFGLRKVMFYRYRQWRTANKYNTEPQQLPPRPFIKPVPQGP